MASGLAIAALAGGAALLMLTRKGVQVPGEAPPIGPLQKVTASSGRKWEVQMAKRIGSDAFFDVFAPAGAFGPHGRMRVLQYRQTGSDQNSRILSAAPDGVPPEMIAAAKQDFGVP